MPPMPPTYYIKDDKEYALSKDVDVVVWQHYSYLESNDLLHFYLREHDCSLTTQAKYGTVFHCLHSTDTVCMGEQISASVSR